MATADNQNPEENDLQEINLDELDIEPIQPSELLEKPAQSLDVISVKRENTRGILALAFLIGFFVMLIIGMIIAALNREGDTVTNVREVILAISGILSGPLGFVIGYYFRSSEEEK